MVELNRGQKREQHITILTLCSAEKIPTWPHLHLAPHAHTTLHSAHFKQLNSPQTSCCVSYSTSSPKKRKKKEKNKRGRFIELRPRECGSQQTAREDGATGEQKSAAPSARLLCRVQIEKMLFRQQRRSFSLILEPQAAPLAESASVPALRDNAHGGRSGWGGG